MNNMTSEMKTFLENQDILGPFVSMFLTVTIIVWIIPKMQKKKKDAREKLRNFYNITYAFVMIRENFSIKIDDVVHNKENCGEFHSFFMGNGKQSVNLIFEEIEFFNFVNANFAYVNKDLQDLFIEYFKIRGPETVQNKIGCSNSKMIKLRKEIEEKIINQYNFYKKIINN